MPKWLHTAIKLNEAEVTIPAVQLPLFSFALYLSMTRREEISAHDGTE